MPDEIDDPVQENAQDAALAQAGEPHGSTDETAASRSADTPPSADQLDQREERLTLPRKAMGPSDDVDETIPDEP